MTIMVDANTHLLVQGITGSVGANATLSMIAAGTDVVAGVTPGKGGELLSGRIPIFDTVEEARSNHPQINTSICFVSAKYVTDAVYEAALAGIGLTVVVTGGVSYHDAMLMTSFAAAKGLRILGPESIGVISPGKSKVGISPAEFFKPGRVGVVLRGGTVTFDVVTQLVSNGMGISTCVNIGDHPILGTTFSDVLRLFESDTETDAVLLVGEIGGRFEEDASKVIENVMTKPVVALINGKSLPPGKRTGHASAIIEHGVGTYESKIRALRESGASIASNVLQVGATVKKAITR